MAQEEVTQDQVPEVQDGQEKEVQAEQKEAPEVVDTKMAVREIEKDYQDVLSVTDQASDEMVGGMRDHDDERSEKIIHEVEEEMGIQVDSPLKTIEGNIKCEKCGEMMHEVVEKGVKYLACTNYPNCDNKKEIKD